MRPDEIIKDVSVDKKDERSKEWFWGSRKGDQEGEINEVGRKLPGARKKDSVVSQKQRKPFKVRSTVSDTAAK